MTRVVETLAFAVSSVRFSGLGKAIILFLAKQSSFVFQQVGGIAFSGHCRKRSKSRNLNLASGFDPSLKTMRRVPSTGAFLGRHWISDRGRWGIAVGRCQRLFDALEIRSA
jgi:hypothetical protein